MVDISVIVPVYNVEDLLPRCVESIMAQTKKSLEIILVDDGATDQSGAICDEYAKKDPRVVVIHQKNSGVSAARNAGLQTLLADFLMFVDIDDALKPQAIEVLLDRAYQENAQIVEGGYEVFDTKVLATEHHIDARLEEPCGVLWGFPWGKVIASSLFCNISFCHCIISDVQISVSAFSSKYGNIFVLIICSLVRYVLYLSLGFKSSK